MISSNYFLAWNMQGTKVLLLRLYPTPQSLPLCTMMMATEQSFKNLANGYMEREKDKNKKKWINSFWQTHRGLAKQNDQEIPLIFQMKPQKLGYFLT